MRRIAVLLAVSLGAGWVSAQEPVSEDRIPIPAKIETWYRLDQNKEPVGWFHETLTTTTMRNYRYEYYVESEYSYSMTNVAGEEVSQFVGEILKAQLEEDFDLYSLDYTLTFGGVQMTINLNTFTESDERFVKLELKADPPSSQEFKFPTTETVHLYLNPMLYRLRQMGSLAQPTRLREKVLIPGQEEAVSVSYTSLALTTKEILGKPAKVTEVKIEGWDRGPLVALTRVWVDKYGRIVEAESADRTMMLMMVKDKAAAVANQRGIANNGRRDPFSKIAAMPLAEKGGPKTPGEGGPAGGVKAGKDVVIPPEKLDAAIAETKALITKLQEEVAKGQMEDARRTYLMILANYKAMSKLVETDVVKRPEVDKLREDAERAYGGVKRLLDTVLAKLERCNDFYLNDNLEGISREVAEIKALRQAPELFRSEDGTAQLEAAIRAAEDKQAQTVARIELGKKTLVLTGTITATEVVQDVVKFDMFVSGSRLAVSQPVTVRRQVTYAVINDEAYREGDLVQREGVKVMKIHRHAVEVEYKKEIRQVVLRK